MTTYIHYACANASLCVGLILYAQQGYRCKTSDETPNASQQRRNNRSYATKTGHICGYAESKMGKSYPGLCVEHTQFTLPGWK